MSELPICIVLGVGGQNPDTVIKGVLGGEVLTETSLESENLEAHKWDIVNKYYNTSIHLCKMTDRILLSESTAERIDALVIYFNSTAKEAGLKEVDEWMPFTDPFDAEVKILVCDQCSTAVDDDNTELLSKVKAHQWCIQHGFELVELDPSEVPDPDDDFPETLGIQRIIQALHAHSWPNMELKSGVDKSRLDHLSRLLLGEDSSQPESNNIPLDSSQQLDRQASEGIDSFEELFQSMSLMKNQAGSLQGAERKAYAEKVTMAFWKAIEGDDAEIEGLDSSAEED